MKLNMMDHWDKAVNKIDKIINNKLRKKYPMKTCYISWMFFANFLKRTGEELHREACMASIKAKKEREKIKKEIENGTP